MAPYRHFQGIGIDILPPELLAHIFHLVRDDALKEVLDHSLYGQTTDLRWIKFSHVCRRWRELAVCVPTLWNNIDVDRPKHATEMLQRSKAAPLHLHSRSAGRNVEPVLLAAEHQMSRMRQLNLQNVDSRLLEFLLHIIDAPAPIVESIRIHTITRFPASSLTQLFRRKMPSLRVLKIENFIIPHSLSCFPNLVSLTLNGPCDIINPLLTVLDTLESLENMPRIEHVKLMEVVAPFAAGDTTSLPLCQRRAIDLPKLRSFTIEGAHLDTVFVVNALRYPSDAFIDIDCRGSRFTEASIQATIDICSRLRSCEVPIEHASIRIASSLISIICGTCCSAKLKLSLYEIIAPIATNVLISRSCEGLPSHTVTWLNLEMETAPLEWWLEFVMLWTGLIELEVHLVKSIFVPQFFEWLRRDAAHPDLEDLTIRGPISSVAALIDLLRHRKAVGLPILRLRLWDYSKYELDSATLQQLNELTTVR